MKRWMLVLNMVWVLTFAGSGFAEKLVFVTTEFPPSVIVTNNEVSGTDVDIVRAICAQLGIEPEIKVVPWARALYLVKEADADVIFSPKKTPERSEFLYFTTEPINTERSIMIVRKNQVFDIRSLADLHGKSIGMVRGFSYGADFDTAQDLKKIECTDDTQLLELFDKGRFDAVIINEKKFNTISQTLALADHFETRYVVSEEFSYIGFSKTSLGQQGEALAKKFSRMLRQLKEDGTLDAIRQRYF